MKRKSSKREIEKLTTDIARLKVTINLREKRERNEADTWQKPVERVTLKKI